MPGLGVQQEINLTWLVKRIEALEAHVAQQDIELHRLRTSQAPARPVSLWEHIFGVTARP